MSSDNDSSLADPAAPLPEWAERPKALTGSEATELGRLILDDAVSGDEILRRARRGPAALGRSGAESPVLRFRVAAEEVSELEKVAEQSHVLKSELLRQGLRLVLDQYRRAETGAPSRSPSSSRGAHGVTVELSDAEAAVLRALARRVAS
jgi:hypothetical protein